MIADPMTRPARGIAWIRSQSHPVSVAAGSIGAAALAVVVVGTFITVLAQGVMPVGSLIAALRSSAVRSVLLAGLALGVVAVVTGVASYRRMPTRLARDQAVGGAVLGVQAIALAGALLWFLSGQVQTFAENFLDLEELRGYGGAFLNGAKNTLILAVTGEAIGIALGLVLAVLAVSRRAVVRAPARIYINFFRGTPLLWQLSAFYFGIALGLGINLGTYTAGIIVFGLNTAAYAAEVFRAGIQSIDRGQLEAARGLGMSYLQALRYAVIPQAFRRVIPPLMNEFVILIKDTSLILFLGLTIGQRDLMSTGQAGYASTFDATFFVATAAGYLAVTLPLIRLVNVLEKRVRSGLVGVTGQ